MATVAVAFERVAGCLYWSIPPAIAQRKDVGTIAGCMNLAGNIAGVLTPIIIGVVVSATGSYDLALLLFMCFGLGISAASLFINYGRKIGSVPPLVIDASHAAAAENRRAEHDCEFHLVLAGDVGTSSVRAMVFDAAGDVKARSQCSYSTIRPAPYFEEQDPDTIRSETYRAMIGRLAQLGAALERAGICFSSQLYGLLRLMRRIGR